MKDISLSLSLLPVGPRKAYVLKDGEVWRFALQVSVGFTDPPGESDDVDAWAVAMLPWIALDTAIGDPIALEWGLFNGTTFRLGASATGTSEGTLEPQSNGVAKPSPRARLEQDAYQEWRKFVNDPEPERILAFQASPVPAESSQDQIFVPSAIQAIAGATPQIASGDLQCTWYFEVPITKEFVKEVTEAGAAPAAIAAWPGKFKDHRTPGLEFRYAPATPANPGFVFTDAVLGIPYRAGTEAPLHAGRTLPFPIGRLQKTQEPALETYWLPTRDSRLDSLSEVQQVIAQSLRPSARMAFLTAEAVVAAGIAPSGDPASARTFLQVARKVFGEDKPLTTIEQEAEAVAVRELLRKAFAKGGELLAALRTVLIEDAVGWWSAAKVIEQVNKRATSDGLIDSAHQWPTNVKPEALFAEFGKFMLPLENEIKPILPGAGMDVLLGAADQRLRHEDSSGNDSDHAQIAALGVLARRAATADGLVKMPWSLATSGVAAIDLAGELENPERYWGSVIDPGAGIPDETIPYDPRPIIRGVTSAFLNGVAHTDITYRGLPMTVSTVGSALHGVQGEKNQGDSTADIANLLPLSYQPVGPVFNEKVEGHRACRIPPLRFGDWYQFAGFVIDRAGGIPTELAKATALPLSCNIDWEKLAPTKIDLLDKTDTFPAIEYLRAVPVGEVNVRPLINAERPDLPPEWKTPPPGVVLRAREWLSARISGPDNVPAVLLRNGAEFVSSLDKFQFSVSAPALDEHTFKEWMMPKPVTPGNAEELKEAQSALERLNDAQAKVHFDRENLPKQPDWLAQEDVLPLDPAVSAIGLRCIFIDENGTDRTTESLLKVKSDLVVQVGESSSVKDTLVALAPGTFAVLEMLPLVSTSDFARFQALAMRALVEEDQWTDEAGATYAAFQPSRILVEAATPALPDPVDLYESLTLRELETGAIEVSLSPKDGQPLPGMAFVDSYELRRERWVWRNRPIIVAGAGPQSALPMEIADPAKRDRTLAVVEFDDLSALDKGLVNRGDIGGRMPRAADSTPLPSPQLVIDDRDAATHADYLRFGCGLISRYAGVLRDGHKRVDAESRHDQDDLTAIEPRRRVKRIAAKFRGDLTTLKAPKVLAVLPLTKGVPPPGDIKVSPDATPFQIVLDEVWFREDGLGERLSVEVVLETKEIGEDKLDEATGTITPQPRPFRIGPLPDHYVTAHLDKAPFKEKRLYEPSTDELQETDASKRHTWAAVGPYGYSLDRSSNEALANATTFFVYPPKEVRPHYAAFVRLRRQLYQANGKPLLNGSGRQVEGPPGATYALYTQPDARQLVAPESVLQISASQQQWKGAGFDLQPTEDADEDVARQYRYLLIAGPTHHDFGRGSDLFLPDRAAWIYPKSHSIQWIGQPSEPGRFSARMMEVLVNGRFDDKKAPIELKTADPDKSQSMREVFKLLFAHDKNPEDALGMIRRYSDPFELSVEP